MKKIVLFLLAAVALVTLLSSDGTLVQQFEEFVNKVDKESASYTEEDWDKVSDQFDALMEVYKNEYENISRDDRELISKSIGRYRAMVVKTGASKLSEQFNKSISEMSVKFQELVGGLSSFFEEIGKN
ncbi:MAG: hypothetical protein IKR69_04850 [Bacteroidales bacterium]|nr:hypothetical protein [Bacteroidales bacterium]